MIRFGSVSPGDFMLLRHLLSAASTAVTLGLDPRAHAVMSHQSNILVFAR